VKNSERIALTAMKKEASRLKARYEKAKSNTLACMNAGSEIIKARSEASKILNGDYSTEEKLKLIEPLAKREIAAFAASKKNLVKLMDKENDIKLSLEELNRDIAVYEYRNKHA